MIKAKSCSLASWHNAYPHFSFRNALESNFVVLGFIFDDVSPGGDIFEGWELHNFLDMSILFGFEIDMIEELIGLLEVDVF